jgi:hypothetical protein
MAAGGLQPQPEHELGALGLAFEMLAAKQLQSQNALSAGSVAVRYRTTGSNSMVSVYLKISV